MQDYSAYPAYVVNAGIPGQDGATGYYMDPRIHGQQSQVTWREGQEDGSASGMAYPSGHYMAWDHKGYAEEDYFNAVDSSEPEPRKRKRRRVISVEQRRAANIRERKRMFQLNEAFCILRKRVPTFAYEKKLSRIETLKLAVTYIRFMTELLEKEDSKGGAGSAELKSVKLELENDSSPVKDLETEDGRCGDLLNEAEK